MENQQKLKDRLLVILRKSPRSQAQAAQDIGMDKTAFHNFFNMKKKTRFHHLLMIEGYLEREEKKANEVLG